MKKIYEIGSEFSDYMSKEGLGFKIPENISDYAFTFSGRTAIEVVLRNLPNVKKALLPSYCCDSMIQPFHYLNIKVYFYNVNYNGKLTIDIDIPNDIDLLLWCNFFGYKVNMPNFDYFIKRGGIIIEDITHSLFSIKKYDNQSHFIVASLRKWGPLFCGGFCASKNLFLKYKELSQPPFFFLNQKKKAMSLKENFLKNENYVIKEQYMSLFNDCNKWLSLNYSNLTIDEESYKYLFRTDCGKIRKKRIANARRLHIGLQDCIDIQMLFNYEDIDCPIFVPIIIKNGKRDVYRKKLILNQIYCPIHWPHPNSECESNLYDLELSLICDQRYTEKDMDNIITLLTE